MPLSQAPGTTQRAFEELSAGLSMSNFPWQAQSTSRRHDAEEGSLHTRLIEVGAMAGPLVLIP
jgi:hypothetical protein